MAMSPLFDAYGSSGGGDVVAIVERDRERARVLTLEGQWPQAMLRAVGSGSAGALVLVIGYGPPHVGTSPAVLDNREVASGVPAAASEAAAEPARTTTRQAVLRLSPAEQALEVLAALSLNKTQLAEVLGVSRPTLYDWLEGKEPNAGNAQRLAHLVELLANAGVTAAHSLSPRFVRQPLNDGEPSLLDLLKADELDERFVAKVVQEAKALEASAEARRLSREERLAALGFEQPSDEQRKKNLDLNVALREWPKE